MSLSDLPLSASPYRSNESGIHACREATLAAWELERAIDARLVLPIVARRWALAITAPIVALLSLVAIVARDWESMWLPGQLALPSFLVLSWSARVVLAVRLARRPGASPLDRLVDLAARFSPWARSSAMLLSAVALLLVSGALIPFEGRGGGVEGTMALTFWVALLGLWTLPTLLVRAFQIGFASRRRGFAPLTVVCGLLWTGLSLMFGPFGVIAIPVCGAAMYGVFALAEWIVRRRFEREDALIEALLRRRAA